MTRKLWALLLLTTMAVVMSVGYIINRESAEDRYVIEMRNWFFEYCDTWVVDGDCSTITTNFPSFAKTKQVMQAQRDALIALSQINLPNPNEMKVGKEFEGISTGSSLSAIHSITYQTFQGFVEASAKNCLLGLHTSVECDDINDFESWLAFEFAGGIQSNWAEVINTWDSQIISLDHNNRK